MTYEEAYSYLLALGNEVVTMKLGLQNIRTLLDCLDKPQDNYLKVQIAGTNGKGSVCAFLDSICNTAEIKTGTFTSPHLVSITERIRINGEDIREGDFARHATFIRETAERSLESGDLEYRPTFFEQITAIALMAFAEAKVQVAILETGLGGRLDATTSANAEIAAITRIDLDHQEYLGETIEEIAAEKAAIIHELSAVVIADQCPEVMAVLQDRLDGFGIAPILGDQVRTACISGRSEFSTKKAVYNIEVLGLKGQHQIENAKAAILLAETLQGHFSISKTDIEQGLTNARHPGRLEFSGRYLFDGAHNPSGAKVLRKFLDDSVTRPITLIFGVMRGKDVAEIAELLFPKADEIILTQPENSRAMSADDIWAQIPGDIFTRQPFLTGNVGEALERAAAATPQNGLILITGSLYLIGEAKKLLKERSQI